MTLNEPILLKKAQKYIGIHEIPGPKSDAFIKKCLNLCGIEGDDSKIAWCGCFMAEIAKECGIDYPEHPEWALNWCHWGKKLDALEIGAVVVFEWSSGGHHVAICSDFNYNWVDCVGGNQSNMVKESTFDQDYIVCIRGVDNG